MMATDAVRKLKADRERTASGGSASGGGSSPGTPAGSPTTGGTGSGPSGGTTGGSGASGGSSDPTGGYLTLADRLAQLLGGPEGQVTAAPVQTLAPAGGVSPVVGVLVLAAVGGGIWYLSRKRAA